MQAGRESMSYNGPERRRNCLFVTRNTEYHVRDQVCVAVRDRRTGAWIEKHAALMHRLSGGILFHPDGGVVPNVGTPRVGESLYFATRGRDVVTSPIIEITRPPKDVAARYSRN